MSCSTKNVPSAIRNWSRSTDNMANSSVATAYPKCKFIRSKTLGIKCLKCDTGELVERVAKKGRRRVFYGCNKYPACDFTTPHLPIPEPCPKCGAPFIVEKRGKMGAIRACLKEGCDWEAVAPGPTPG